MKEGWIGTNESRKSQNYDFQTSGPWGTCFFHPVAEKMRNWEESLGICMFINEVLSNHSSGMIIWLPDQFDRYSLFVIKLARQCQTVIPRLCNYCHSWSTTTKLSSQHKPTSTHEKKPIQVLHVLFLLRNIMRTWYHIQTHSPR